MKKKSFHRSELQNLIASHKPHLSRTTDRLRHALIGHRLIELFGSKLSYGWWLPFDRFIADASPPCDKRVAPLCLFKSEANDRWAAAAVIACSPSGGAADPAHSATADMLRAVGIHYLTISAAEVDGGHLNTDAFASAISCAIARSSHLAIRSSPSPSQEGFLSEPRPIYPPRSRSLRN